MSEDQNELQPKKECKCTATLIISIIALVLSIAALTMAALPYFGEAPAIASKGAKKEVKISTQYDKGRSLEKAQATKKPIVVFFYTDWCGFCQRFAPTFDKVTKDKAIKNKYAVAFVNCEKAENHKLMEEYGVQGFPTVFVIKEDGTKTQLENNTFFNDDSVKVIKEKMLELIEG